MCGKKSGKWKKGFCGGFCLGVLSFGEAAKCISARNFLLAPQQMNMNDVHPTEKPFQIWQNGGLHLTPKSSTAVPVFMAPNAFILTPLNRNILTMFHRGVYNIYTIYYLSWGSPITDADRRGERKRRRRRDFIEFILKEKHQCLPMVWWEGNKYYTTLINHIYADSLWCLNISKTLSEYVLEPSCWG